MRAARLRFNTISSRRREPVRTAMERDRQIVMVAVEIGLYFVLAEGLLRRAMPTAGVMIMAVKYVWFPVVYLLVTALNVPVNWSIHRTVSNFLLLGSCLSLIGLATHPITSLIGLATNLSFVPISCLVSSLYFRLSHWRAVVTRLAVASGIIGAIGLYCTLLPENHWLNLGVDGEVAVPGRAASCHSQCCCCASAS